MRFGALMLIPLLLACDSGRAVEGDAQAQPDGQPPGCGDPAVMQKFSSCMAAKSKSACEQAGGSWTTIGLSSEPSCSCPTGQGGCSCTSADDCLGSCVAPMPTMWDCDQVKQGSCTERSPSVGCWCWFGSDGKVQGICAD